MPRMPKRPGPVRLLLVVVRSNRAAPRYDVAGKDLQANDKQKVDEIASYIRQQANQPHGQAVVVNYVRREQSWRVYALSRDLRECPSSPRH